MNINELESLQLSDYIKFHDQLNPVLWDENQKLRPTVQQTLLAIAEDFREFLGIENIGLKDITVSGSNAGYNYTDHSDIDLHLVVDLPQADVSEVYRELFDAKKYQYNDLHNITVGGHDVELYVQNANEPHYSQGIYSVLNDQWNIFPKKIKTNIDDDSVISKYQDLQHRINSAVSHNDLDKIQELIKKLKTMRSTGLAQQGEFSVENLTFKLLRSTDLIKQLYDRRNELHDQQLSLNERKKRRKTKKVRYGHGGYWYPGFSWSTDTAAGSDGGGGESINEQIDIKDNIKLFAKEIMDELGIVHRPKIILHSDPNWTVKTGSFGQYNPSDNQLQLAITNRHILDILRTLAHELVHCAQRHRGQFPDDAGETGSPYEDEANALAGRIMRGFADRRPELFQDIELSESSGYIPTEKEKNDPRFSTALTVDIRPGETGRQANKLKLNTDAQGHPELLMKRKKLSEEWSEKYKKSINCNNPRGFSQRAHCQGRKKHNENQDLTSLEEATDNILRLRDNDQDQIRAILNDWMNKDQEYKDPTSRKSFQTQVWPYIQKNIDAILSDKGDQGNGDYPAAPYAAWLLVQHMDAFPENQIEFYKKLKQAIPNHPKIKFLRDRAAVNKWILKHADDPRYYYEGKPLPNPTVNVRNPAIFADAGMEPTSAEEALSNAKSAGNRLLVAAVQATGATTQPSFTQGVAESLRVDVPNEEWLQGKIAYAKKKGRDRFGVPDFNATTAYYRPDVRVPIEILRILPGMRGEQRNVRQQDIQAIKKILKDTGRLPLNNYGQEYVPFVMVAYNGEAWVNEGNHRIMAAAELYDAGDKRFASLPIELKYFDGGERVKSGPLHPSKISQQGVAEDTMRAWEFLSERISSRVFHYTRVTTALKIVESGQFELSHILGSTWEAQFAPKGHPYFLSTTRTRHGGYHGYLGQDAVLFELDGDFYNQRYPGKAVDYWNNRDPMRDHHKAHEAEDRIFSREPAIPASIRTIDLYTSVEADEMARARSRRLLISAKKAGIPINFFNDETAWRQRDLSKPGNIALLTGNDDARGYVSRRRGGYLKPWMELIQAKKKSQLSKDADSKRYNLQYTYDKQGMAKSLAVDLSNARKPGPDADRNNAVRVIQFMLQNRLDTVNDLVNFLSDKWKNIKEGVAEENLSEFAPSPDYRDDDDRQDMPLLKFAKIIKLFLGSEYTMVDHKRPDKISVEFYPKDKTSGRNGAILYSLIGKQNEYPTVNFMLIDFEQGPEIGRSRKAGTAIPKTRTNALKIADIIYNTVGLPAQDRKISENFADGRNPGRRGLAKRMGVPTKASVSRLRQIAKSSSGEKQRMAHWMANMKAGKKK